VSKATRFQNNTATLIDQILLNSRELEIYSGTLISDVSDHLFTFVMPHSLTPNMKPVHKTNLSRDFSNANLTNFRNELGMTDWNTVLNIYNVDESYEEFWRIYTEIYNRNFTLKRMRFNKNIHKVNNFMTPGLLVSRKSKKILHKKSLSEPSAENISKYKTFKTVYSRVIRAAKKLYFMSKLEANAGNPKKIWQTLNEILGKGRKSDSIEKLNINGVPSTNPTDISNHFNKFFTEIGQQISDNVPPVTKQAEDYIQYNRDIPEMNLQNTTPEHVLKTINKFKSKNSSDVQGVTSKMIKFIGREISIPLSHIFNLSLSSGLFPSQLKTCRVIPIFKSGSCLECDNYRPISLLSSISKVLEKIVSEKLIAHLVDNDLLYTHQYGFLPHKSTEHSLMQILTYVSKALNDGNFCIGIFLDLKKAFDVCSHSILLKKLNKMGITGTALNWFKNYLSGRSQIVEVNGCKSDARELNISVIQGSILGPILFLCYINDFYSATTLFSVLFADDTAGFGQGKNLKDLTSYVNQELQKIANWFRSNKMAVNTLKTKFIIFRTRGKRIDPQDCRLVFNNNEIGLPEDPALITDISRIHNEGEEKSFKLLGVMLDEYLSFEAHVNNLCVKISKSLFCMNRIKNFVNPASMKMLYFAMVQSHLVYCINIYGCANKTTLNRLFLKQKEAIRIMSNVGYRDHTSPLFVNHKILPLEKLIKMSNLKFMHCFVNNRLPFSFNEMWITNRNRNPALQLRNADDFYVPAHRFETVKRFPYFTFPKLWNEEPVSKHIQSKKIFCASLKSALLSSIVV
jgi:hypothetical protein